MKCNLKCKSCKERTPGCHGSCQDYIDWRKEYDVIAEKERTARFMQNIGATKSATWRR